MKLYENFPQFFEMMYIMNKMLLTLILNYVKNYEIDS
jgi:hypothetical protein